MGLLTEAEPTSGLTLVIVTHEADMAAWARRGIVFRDGQIVEDDRQQIGSIQSPRRRAERGGMNSLPPCLPRCARSPPTRCAAC